MDEPTYRALPMLSIRPPSEPHRVGMDEEALGRLADSIAANGLLQPIGVAGPDAAGLYEIAFGHRRFLAHQRLNRGEVSCRVWPAGTPLDDIRSVENYEREQLTPVEEALDVQRRLARGESRAAICRTLRRSPAWLQAREALLSLPDELRARVHAGELTIGVACELGVVDHPPYRNSLVTEAVERGATLSTVRVWVAHYQADRARIISNEMAVQEIIEARQAFVAYYACESCGKDVPFTDTRAWRFCLSCSREIAEAVKASA